MTNFFLIQRIAKLDASINVLYTHKESTLVQKQPVHRPDTQIEVVRA